jgi:hypothetical protein
MTFKQIELLVQSINNSQSNVVIELKRDIHSFPYSVYIYKTFGSHARHFTELSHVEEYLSGVRDTLESLR